MPQPPRTVRSAMRADSLAWAVPLTLSRFCMRNCTSDKRIASGMSPSEASVSSTCPAASSMSCTSTCQGLPAGDVTVSRPLAGAPATGCSHCSYIQRPWALRCTRARGASSPTCSTRTCCRAVSSCRLRSCKPVHATSGAAARPSATDSTASVGTVAWTWPDCQVTSAVSEARPPTGSLIHYRA